MEAQRAPSTSLLLLIRSRARVCAIPLQHVTETMRCLPLQPAPHAPPFVLGISVIRGEPVPVVDLGLLLGDGGESRPTRLVALRVGGRAVALAVDAVLRIVPESATSRHPLPPLLRGTGEGTVRALALLDREFLSVLESGRLVPEEIWNGLTSAGAAR